MQNYFQQWNSDDAYERPKTIYWHILGNAHVELIYWLRCLSVAILHNIRRLNLFEGYLPLGPQNLVANHKEN